MDTVYCIDTSALIAAWYERYKPNRFPRLWEQLDRMAADGRLVSSLLVLNECSKRSPELHAWLKDRAHMFIAPEVDIQVTAGTIINTYRGLVAAGKEKFAADPFVIATAQVNGYTVVTEETGLVSRRFEEVVSKIAVIFEQGPDGQERGLDALSDGQQSLFYFALAAAVFDMEREVATGKVKGFQRPASHSGLIDLRT